MSAAAPRDTNVKTFDVRLIWSLPLTNLEPVMNFGRRGAREC